MKNTKKIILLAILISFPFYSTAEPTEEDLIEEYQTEHCELLINLYNYYNLQQDKYKDTNSKGIKMMLDEAKASTMITIIRTGCYTL